MPEIIIEIRCRDFGGIGCLSVPDEKFTMDFSDINQGQIHWCSNCGPKAARLYKAFIEAMNERGPEFREMATDAINKAANAQRAQES